jgi:hypothetical protein
VVAALAIWFSSLRCSSRGGRSLLVWSPLRCGCQPAGECLQVLVVISAVRSAPRSSSTCDLLHHHPTPLSNTSATPCLHCPLACPVPPGGRAGGSITAALFLKEFIKEGVDWAHLDIAGPVSRMVLCKSANLVRLFDTGDSGGRLCLSALAVGAALCSYVMAMSWSCE